MGRPCWYGASTGQRRVQLPSWSPRNHARWYRPISSRRPTNRLATRNCGLSHLTWAYTWRVRWLDSDTVSRIGTARYNMRRPSVTSGTKSGLWGMVFILYTLYIISLSLRFLSSVYVSSYKLRHRCGFDSLGALCYWPAWRSPSTRSRTESRTFSRGRQTSESEWNGSTRWDFQRWRYAMRIEYGNQLLIKEVGGLFNR